MKAAVLGENGIEVRDLPKPDPKPNQVVIRVRASSLNRADLLVSEAGIVAALNEANATIFESIAGGRGRPRGMGTRFYEQNGSGGPGLHHLIAAVLRPAGSLQ